MTSGEEGGRELKRRVKRRISSKTGRTPDYVGPEPSRRGKRWSEIIKEILNTARTALCQAMGLKTPTTFS